MKYILHSVSYSKTWKGQSELSLDGFIEKAAELGYDGIELMGKRPHASPLDLSGDDRKKLKEAIDSKGLELPCIAGYHDFSRDLNHPDMPCFEKEILFLRETIRLAYDLGAGIVRTFSGFLRPEIPFDDQWGWCVSNLKEGVRYAEDLGIILALQNHSPLAVHHQDVLQMVAEIGSPNMKVALDAPYVAATMTPLEKAVLDTGTLMVYSTASDHVSRTIAFHHSASSTFSMKGKYQLDRTIAVPVGTGEVDYTEFFRALKKIGYDAYMAYEICSPIDGGGTEANLDRCARESLYNMRKICNAVYDRE